MKLLALDTSSVACSVALQIEEHVVERHEEQPREHTRLLMPMIRGVLEETGIRVTDLDSIVLGNGPGSFIGMRIAASVAQGLAFAAGLKIMPVSSLAAVAAQVFAETDASEAVIAQDAHMSEVYFGRYRHDGTGTPHDVVPERLQGIAEIVELDMAASPGRILAGFGWRRYPELASLNRGRYARAADIYYPRARYLLRIAAAAGNKHNGIAPQDVVPAYLRHEVAQKPA